MNTLSRTGAAVALTLILAVSSFAGTIHSPGVVDPPPPPSQSLTLTNNITTTVITTIIGLTR
ncbi:MAG TPA: hypothetical protein VFY67_10865 [Pyrinomonadaceae bacterium]|nr:hypothetical protein [Pyrinomonadaceae bacterium]